MSVRTITIAAPTPVVCRRSPAEVYARRRLGAVVVVVALVVAFLLAARAAGVAQADRGGVPASATPVRPGAEPYVPAAITYVVGPGDTLWSIAERFHGGAALDWYVDELVELNGSASVDVGQQILLP